MIKRIQQLITQLSAHPKRLFLIDGLGAFLTAFMLGVVLANFESSFGMPLKTLYFLSFLAGLFCLYSFFCYFLYPLSGGLFSKRLRWQIRYIVALHLDWYFTITKI
jgi:thiol:disulfide interchange protein